MSLIKKLAGETAIYGIPTIVGKMLNFVVISAYMTSLLPDDQYGYMTNMFVFAAIGVVLFTYRMETTLFRFGSKEQSSTLAFTTAASMVLLTAGVLVILICGFSKSLATLFLDGQLDLNRYFYYFAAILAFDACAAIPFARLRLENKSRWFATLKTINIFLNFGIILLLFEVLPKLGLHYDPAKKLDIVFMANMITSLVVLILIIPTYKTSIWRFDKELAKQMIRYTWPLAVIALAGVINQYGQYPLLQWIFPEGGEIDAIQAVGRYSGAAKLAIFMSLFTTAFNFAAEPFFFKQAAGSDDRSVYGKVAAAYTLVAVIVFLGITFYMDILQLILRRPEYREAVDAVPTLLMAFLCLGLYYNVAIWYKLADKTRYGMLISIGGSIVTIVFNILLIPHYGYHGCAMATLICFALMVITCYYLGQLYYPIDYPVTKILKYIVIGLVFWFIASSIRPYFEGNILAILGVNTLLIIGYIVCIYTMDKRYLKSIIA